MDFSGIGHEKDLHWYAKATVLLVAPSPAAHRRVDRRHAVNGRRKGTDHHYFVPICMTAANGRHMISNRRASCPLH